MSDERSRQLRQEVAAAGGHWPDHAEDLFELDPDFLAAALRFAAAPTRRQTLEPRVRELLGVALAAAATHLHRPRLELHVRRALDEGATVAEILETFELTSVLGIHATTVAVPILLEELAAVGEKVADRPLTESEEQLKAEFIRVRGYWSELWDGVLALDPDFFESYFRFSAVPFEAGVLEPKVKELIYVAIDASTTHLFEPGIRIHVRNALGHGATPAEIMAVLELTAVQGMETVEFGLPVLLAEARRRREQGS
jgi:alkylhydroperoxidase/carboxymuconolactone decarboxylase family protein YurZ